MAEATSSTSPAIEDAGKIDEVPDVDLHREFHSDPEKLEQTATQTTDPPKRRQPFSAVWTVIACGFALMSDGYSRSQNI